MKASVYIAASLDGFIARENGDLDWLPGAAGEAGQEDYGYQAFISTVDVLVMGRSTFEKVLTFGDWPYTGKAVVVLSHGLLAIPEKLASGVEASSLAPRALLDELDRRGLRHAYVDGGRTIQGFLREGLIDELTVTTVPVLLGGGIPLFGPLTQDIRLRHLETRAYPNGLVQNRYALRPAGQA